MEDQRLWFSVVLVRYRVTILIILGMVFVLLVLACVCHLEEATFSPLSVRPSTNALHNVFNIGLNYGTHNKAVSNSVW